MPRTLLSRYFSNMRDRIAGFFVVKKTAAQMLGQGIMSLPVVSSLKGVWARSRKWEKGRAVLPRGRLVLV